MAEALPRAVADATFTLFGVPLRCYVLDNGMRVIHEEDVAAFIEALATGDGANDGSDSLDQLARWLKGLD